MNREQTIAAVVLTLNEETDLPRALRSLSWCDELIVLDSGSTDHTYEIAEEYGARFVKHIQSPPFLITDQRNWALDHADISSEWILFLDADEEVGELLAKAIRSCINSPVALDAYELTPRYWFLGRWLKHTQGYPNWHPRLVRRRKAYFEGGVWESFSHGSRVGKVKVPYEHYAFSKGFDDWLERHCRYATWDASEILAFNTNEGKYRIHTVRHKYLRKLAAKYFWFRPLARFVQKYLIQLGFLEGWQSLLFCLMMFSYDLMTVVKVIEAKRTSKGLPL